MTVETATSISGLNPLSPAGSDPKAEGDNHLRLLKSVLQTDFDDSGGVIKPKIPFSIGTRLVLSPADMALVGHTGTPDYVAFNSKADGSGSDIATIDKAGKLVIASDAAVTGNVSVTGNVAIAGNVSALHGIPDYISGMTMVNNATTPNTIVDILAGECKGNGKLVFSAATVSKKLDVAWAAGSGNGGLDTGSKQASKTYFIWAIRKQSDGSFDWLYSLSVSAPTVPAGYDAVKVLCPLLTDASGNIRPQLHTGDTFLYRATVLERSTAAASASALVALVVPTGIIVRPILSMNINAAAGGAAFQSLGDARQGNALQTVFSLGANSSQSSAWGAPPPVFSTNTAGQLYWGLAVSGTLNGAELYTAGFIWKGGRV